MGTTLTGTTPQDTYDSLIKVTDNGPLTGSLKTLTDGLGNDSALALSTTAASVTGTLTTSSITRAERLQVGTVASLNTPAGTGNTLQFANYSPSVFVTGSADSYIYKNSGVFGGLAAQSLVFQTRSDTTGGGFAFVAGGTPAVVATITGAGNVGIGTSAPQNRLSVQTSTVYAAQFTTSIGTATTTRISIGGFAGVAPEVAGDAAIGAAVNHGSNSESALVFYTNTGSGLTEKGRFLAGGGLTFNGDTAAANALDDYEEGTFTPTVEGNSSAGTATYSVQIGKYTKIGNQISILIDLAWSGGTGTGNLRIVGLPFTNVAFNAAGTIGFINDIALTASNYATTYVAPSSTRLDFVQSPTGGGGVTDIPYDAAGRLIISATYFNV